MTALTLPFQKPADIDSRRIKLSLIDVPDDYESADSLVEDDALRKSIAGGVRTVLRNLCLKSDLEFQS